VRALFAAEDPAHPLSDDEALAQLKLRGFELARRTLAKYRSELGIKSSYLRRRH
jgi:RNA polymerase sigma-54 factor